MDEYLPKCTATRPKVITSYNYQSAADRRFDWYAHRENFYEGDPCGWGPTEQAAIKDLMETEQWAAGPDGFRRA